MCVAYVATLLKQDTLIYTDNVNRLIIDPALTYSLIVTDSSNHRNDDTNEIFTNSIE